MILSSRKSLNFASSGPSATIKLEAVISDVICWNLSAIFAIFCSGFLKVHVVKALTPQLYVLGNFRPEKHEQKLTFLGRDYHPQPKTFQ